MATSSIDSIKKAPVKETSWFQRMIYGPHACIATIVVAFCESSFFPIPPDIGMISIIVHDRSKAWYLAFWCSIASVLGGLLGYGIGAYLFDSIGHTIIEMYGLDERFYSLKNNFHAHGFWILLLKGLTPIPYKLLTIASGVFHFGLWQFIIASMITRTGRFFALAAVLWYVGPLAKPYLQRFLGWISFAILLLVIMGFILVKCF